MSDAIATPVLWLCSLQFLIADHQRRGVYKLDARDSLGGLPGLKGCILVGHRASQCDNTVRCRNIDFAIWRSRRNLGLHVRRDLAV